MKYLAVILFFLVSASTTFAAKPNQFITLVNPVRISSYNPDPLASIQAQYRIVSTHQLPATWLLTYDILAREELVNFLKTFSSNQELGIFLEVTPGLASASGVNYQQSGSWHFANSVFLSGYSQADRIKLLDTVFAKFKNTFNYFPVSVGSWWTDSYSLNYLVNNHHVTGNLAVADQFSTDGYQVWGQYWSTPFYPSRYHTGIPAQTFDSKTNLVNFQWAPREPYLGYVDSLYSTQDYPRIPGLSTDYFKELVHLYASQHTNKFGQITVGLESDLPAEIYSQEFFKQIQFLSSNEAKSAFTVTTMASFANWYQQAFPDLSPPHLITTPRATWYQSPFYRIGIVGTKIRDLRVYSSGAVEPYYLSPNNSPKLTINILAPIDEVSFSQESWLLPDNTRFDFNVDSFTISPVPTNIPIHLTKNPLIQISHDGQSLKIAFSRDWVSPLFGQIKSAVTSEALHFFSQKKALFFLITGRGWNHFRTYPYLVTASEMEALVKLSTLPPGRVLVPNQECLQCVYHTPNRPLVFSNQRDYVSIYGKHPVVKDSHILSSDISLAKTAYRKSNARYIYLTQIESYRETPLFSPGDLAVNKIFENANAQIWQAVK